MNQLKEDMSTERDKPKPVNMIVLNKDDKVSVRFDRPLNFLVMEAVDAIRIGEMLKEKGIEILRGSSE